MSKRHKYAELIHAWAEGTKIQIETDKNIWEDCEHPQWLINSNYRIKPEEPEELILKYRNYLIKEPKTGWYRIKAYDYNGFSPESGPDFVCWLTHGWDTYKVELKCK